MTEKSDIARILNCGEASQHSEKVRFKYRCPKQWQEFQATKNETIRFCNACQENVYYCNDKKEADSHARQGHCIAISSKLALDVYSQFTPFLAGRPDTDGRWASDIFDLSKHELVELRQSRLKKYLQDPSHPVKARVAIAKSKDLSLTILFMLAQDSSIAVRSALAKNPLISEQIAANLAQDLVPQVIDALLENSALPASVFNFIFEQTCHETAKPQIQEIDLCYQCCPSKYYDTSPFGAFNPYDFRTSAIYEPAIHGEDPISAASHKIARFAKHPLTTVKILQQLKNNKYSKVRETVASSPQITEEIVNELAKDLSCWVRANIARNQVTPRSILEQLSCDLCSNVRLAVAKNPQTFLASLRDLMYDRDSDIAEAAMKNIDSPKI